MRRAVLVLALVLVVGAGVTLVSLIGGDGGSAPTAGDTAAPAKATPTTRPTPTPTPKPPPVRRGKAADRAPSGPCLARNIAVRGADDAVTGGSPTGLTLELRSTAGTCTFEASARTLVVRITSGDDRIWSSQDCPRSLPEQSVIVRDNRWVEYSMEWSGQRSAEGCPRGTAWAEGGYYHLTSATLGGQPRDVQFQVVAPKAPVVTRTITATPRPRTEQSGD
ncbi:hypothetical protein GCM10027425_29260 [Alteromonas gracilis]